MKRKSAIITAGMLIVCLAMTAPAFAKAKTYKNLTEELTTKTLSQKTVKIMWKKHKVDKYTIYKMVMKKDGSSKWKKLKTVSGKKKSAVIKAGKNEYLYLQVTGINKKKNIEYNGTAICWTGLATPDWDDYEFPEGKCSPSYIELTAYGGGGLKVSGYEIYRKAKGAKSYKKIKTVKTKKPILTWKDKSVKARKAYYYKVRSYRKSGKKKLYSKKSESMLRYAVNYNGKYQVSSEKAGDQLTLSLSSDSNNGETLFHDYDLYWGVMPTDEEGACYKLTEYSLDGTTWNTIGDTGKKTVLKAGKTMWFRLTKDTYDPEWYEDASPWDVTVSCSYRNVPSFLSIPADYDRTTSWQDAESIH